MPRAEDHAMKPIAQFLLFLLLAVPAGLAAAASGPDIDRESREALGILYRSNPTAASIAKSARAILVFPKIIKAGLVFGGSYGEGELLKGGKGAGFYNSVSGSWGLQAGAQSYGYAVFLMSEKAEKYIKKTDGWEIGVGPTVVIVDEGAAKNLSTSTLKDDAYAFIFDQEGLMAGISLEGSKISRITR
jgi:lipid-binding SYLF domain-containing protein